MTFIPVRYFLLSILLKRKEDSVSKFSISAVEASEMSRNFRMDNVIP